MKSIVGFKFIDEVQAAFKLIQNQHERDYAGIIIEQMKAEGEVEMADAMKKIRRSMRNAL
ncbi:hypothetical protein [Bacillus altitudinis]|uniref:hypothetical protein n=1 Tax=Bacillus altitudinis TaxID=293387 RepID=UPI00064CA160|nr:hypothetical protein [Bacillus altitudinis]KLV15341.1 hypothetical protein ABW03_18740 [Bacillus altitudinis]